MAAVISVPYSIMWDSGIVEGWPQDGPYAVVKYRTDTANRYQLASDLRGTASAIATPGGLPLITRVMAHRYPPSTNLICKSIDSIEMIGGPVPLLTWANWPAWISKQSSIVTARYETATFSDQSSQDPSGQPYTTTTFTMSSEVLTLPGSVYKFPSGTPASNAGRQIPQIQISMKRFMVPYLPLSACSQCIGRVNLYPLTFSDLVCPTGTLLFVGANAEIAADTSGNVHYTVDYQLVYRPIPWNNYLSPKPNEGFAQITDQGGNTVYQAQDFSILP